MTHKLVVRPVCLLLLFAVIHNVTSDCRFHLKNIGNRPLLIYKYKPDGTPVFHYPHEETDCIVKKKEDQRIYFACPGPKSESQMLHVDTMDEDGSFSRVDVFNSRQRSMYLLNDIDENFLRVDSIIVKFLPEGSIMQCWSSLVPIMRKTGEIRSSGGGDPRDYYAVSFRLNEIDTLNVFEIVYFLKAHMIMAHIRIHPIIKKQRYINWEQLYEIDKEYRIGSIYQRKKINFTELYSPEYQKASFEKHYQNSEWTKKYFSGNNSLVIGQLIFAEDMLYAAEQMSMYYYENTLPIWKSVYEGNWKLVRRVIRKLVDESVHDMEVYAWGFINFDFSSQQKPQQKPWVLGNSTSSPDFLVVPRLLVKAVVDVGNRGMVFHTYNDPYWDLKTRGVTICSQTTDCAEWNPQFKNMTRGSTFCCYPEDSMLLKKMLPL